MSQSLHHLSPLPYKFEALEPCLNRKIIELHHDVHHLGYVENLNRALMQRRLHDGFETRSLEEILSRVSEYDPDIRFNGGGHWNHTFYWSVMSDRKEDHEISPELLEAIRLSFGSIERLKNRFIERGTAHSGAGWIWMIKTPAGHLELTTTENQDNPLMDVVEPRGTPLIACDLWEHAYYLQFQSRREDYLRRFFAVINWNRVHSLLTKNENSSILAY